MTNFDVGNGERVREWRENEEMEKEGGNGERGRKWRENEEMEKEEGNAERMRQYFESISLHFLATWKPGCHNLCNPAQNTAALNNHI